MCYICYTVVVANVVRKGVGKTKTLEALRTLGAATVDQYGLITSAQAQKLGVDRTTLSRLADGGDLEIIRRGVYGMISSSIDQLRELRAAWLATAPELYVFERVKSLTTPVVALESATTVHELGNLIPSKHTFITATRKQSRHQDLRFVRKELSWSDVTVVHGLQVTTVQRTIKDLAKQALDGGHLVDVVKAALKRSLLTPEQLVEALSDSAQRYGYADARQFAETMFLLERVNRASGFDGQFSPKAINSLGSARVLSAVNEGNF